MSCAELKEEDPSFWTPWISKLPASFKDTSPRDVRKTPKYIQMFGTTGSISLALSFMFSKLAAYYFLNGVLWRAREVGNPAKVADFSPDSCSNCQLALIIWHLLKKETIFMMGHKKDFKWLTCTGFLATPLTLMPSVKDAYQQQAGPPNPLSLSLPFLFQRPFTLPTQVATGERADHSWQSPEPITCSGFQSLHLFHYIHLSPLTKGGWGLPTPAQNVLSAM